MRRRVATKLTYANVLSTLAIFLVLGGGAYAATTLPKNSVGTEQIERDGVTKPDVAPDAIGTAELKAEAVRTKEVADGSLECKDFKPAADACGRGPAGVPGEPGEDGADAVGGGGITTVARSHTETIELTCSPPFFGASGYETRCDGEETVRAECAPGEVVTGGSTEATQRFSENHTTGESHVSTAAAEDRPDPASGAPTAWIADVTSSGSGQSYDSNVAPTPPPDQDFTVYVVCAS